MTVSVLKCYFAKAEPKVMFYRDYKKFSNESFRSLITNKNRNLQDHNVLDSFLDISKYALDETAPLKRKCIRANSSPFMNKTISRESMKRTRIRNKFLRERTEANRRAYNIQRNYCVSLMRKTKRYYYSNLNHKQVTDNKIFWKTVKPFFADKGVNNEKMTLIENGETLPKNEEIVENLNDYFSDIRTNLKLPPYEDPTIDAVNITDPVLKAIEKYKNHRSIRIINDKYKTNSVFTFNQISLEEIELKNLNPSKASQSSDIPTKIIRQNLNLFAPIVHIKKLINH